MHLTQNKEIMLLNFYSSLFGTGSYFIMIYLYLQYSISIKHLTTEFDTELYLRSISLTSNFLAISLLLLHQHCSRKLFKKSTFSLSIHILIYLIYPFFPSSFLICVPYYLEESCYSINDLIIVLMMTRIFLLFLACLQFTKYFKFHSLTNLKTIGPTSFACKSLYSQNKLIMNTIIIAFGNLGCAFTLSILESRNGNLALTDLSTASWCALVSGLGIGFGDFCPFTLTGRAVVVIWVFFCSAFFWYFILQASNFFTMNRIEFLVYRDINRREKAMKFILKYLKGQNFQQEKQSFYEERKRQYTSPNNYGTFIIDLYELPPEDFRATFLRIKLLENNLDALTESLEHLSRKFSILFLNK